MITCMINGFANVNSWTNKDATNTRVNSFVYFLTVGINQFKSSLFVGESGLRAVTRTSVGSKLSL